MLSGPFLSKSWMSSNEDFDASQIVMVGLPYDGTCSYRPGSRFAPQEIRLASIGIEEFSFVQNKSLEDVSFFDAGDLDLPFGNRDKSLEMIKTAAKETLKSGKKFLGIGGEHLVTLPVVEAYLEKYPNLVVIHFDAHADLREDYLDEKLSHACVIKRIVEKILPQNLFQIGIRSGTKEEFDFIKDNKTLLKTDEDFDKAIEKIADKPVFITIDLDVLDPSIFSGTGTPEPGGLLFCEFLSQFLKFKKLNIVGADVVELAPHYDTSAVSTIVATKIIREILIAIS